MKLTAQKSSMGVVGLISQIDEIEWDGCIYSDAKSSLLTVFPKIYLLESIQYPFHKNRIGRYLRSLIAF